MDAAPRGGEGGVRREDGDAGGNDDGLEWGHGPLAIARQQGRPAASSDGSRSATASSGGVEHGALARAAAVRAAAAGGRGKKSQRRKKEKKAGFKASELLSRQADDPDAAGDDRARAMARGAATAAPAARQPFGAVASTHRRRAGGRSASTQPHSEGRGGAGGGGSPATPAAAAAAVEPAAPGCNALTDAQLAVVREVFEHVDCGNKGWLCRDDVQHIVHTLNKPTATRHEPADAGRATGGGQPLSKSQALERTRILPGDAAAEHEQRKQDSAREATSPIPDDDEEGDDGQRWASRSVGRGRLTTEEMERQVAEAEKERQREGRRQRKRAEREAAATVELLKVLVPPESRSLRQAGGAGAEPPVRLSLEDFSKAVDSAMANTSSMAMMGSGARPGELYCRKMVTHWRWARGDAGSYDQGYGSSSSSGSGAAGGSGYAEMLELLVPLSMRDMSGLEEEELLQ